MAGTADLIVTHGRVLTVDRSFSIAGAVAVKENRILAVGAPDEVAALADESTRIVDARGRAVIPGLIDGHAHMDREGLKSVLPSLAGCRSIDDVLQRIEALARDAEPGAWIVTMPIGEPPYYFDPARGLREGRYPTRWELDRAAPDNPVYIRPIWGYWRHVQPLDSVVNSRALAAAGIDRDFVPPSPEIEFERDAETGELNGIVHEWTYMPIVELSLLRMSPGFSPAQRAAGLAQAMAIYNRTGTTSVFEEHGAAQELIRAYQTVRDAGKASVRANLVFSPAWDGAEAAYGPMLARWAGWLGGRGLGDSWLRVAGVYTEFGPTAESRLRAQASPYTGWAGFNPDHGVPRARMKEFLIEAARNGIRVAALSMEFLDLYEEVDRTVPIGDMRWILGHLNTVTEDQARRLARLGIAMTTHTNRYVYKQAHATRDEIGADREDDIVPLARLRGAGVHVGLATDNVPTSLFYPIWQAVARPDLHGRGPVGAAQRLSRQDALSCATVEGAWLTFEEDEKGSIEAGKLADLAILSDDPLACDEDRLKDVVADVTIVDGRIVHRREGAA